MRIFAVSDIHVDYDENARWFIGLSNIDFQDDTLLLAGDITADISLLASTLNNLASKFNNVVFLPGNHDLWVNPSESIGSIEKFAQVLAIAENSGAITKPYSHQGVWICPLLSWYDFSFGSPSQQLLHTWTDFKACAWPEKWTMNQVTDFFLQKNSLLPDTTCHTRITLSHFLPRIDLLPGFIPQRFKYLYPIMGSAKLDDQIRAVNANVHIYGHSHVNRQVTIDGVCYLNNAFGYPAETRISRKNLTCVYES